MNNCILVGILFFFIGYVAGGFFIGWLLVNAMEKFDDIAWNKLRAKYRK